MTKETKENRALDRLCQDAINHRNSGREYVHSKNDFDLVYKTLQSQAELLEALIKVQKYWNNEIDECPLIEVEKLIAKAEGKL